jgi:alpha-L-arabinofuranosidase
MRLQRRFAMLTLTTMLAGAVISISASTAQAASPSLTIQVNKSSATTSSTQWGHIVEDIGHSVEGGLNANLVRNSTMKEGGANPPASWSLVTSGTGAGSISTDTSTPLNSANRSALKLAVTANGGVGSVGVANSGFYGVGLKPKVSYTATFFARATGGFAGSMRVELASTAGTVYADADTTALTDTWQRYTVDMLTSAATPVGTANRIILSPNGTGTGAVYLNVVQVTPPTYRGTGLRQDLMEKMASIKPGFWRVPGGNYLEGNTLATRFDWKNTIGPVETRPGHQNDAWGYWSTDQAGLKAYLDMAESTGAEPLLGLFAGYTLNGTKVAQADLQSYVQDALDEIQYVTGAADTTWGARRVADGHPEPYKLNYVEIGNEDFFDTSGSYNSYRFPMFYDAIRAAYPDLKIVASTPVSSRTPDVLDDHYYSNSPSTFTNMANQYDLTSRTGPKILVGEYAVTDGGANSNPTGSLGGAIGEAAFMAGLLRNADVVMGASYAPALADVKNFSWATNLIGFDSGNSFGSPSFYVQQMFGANKGEYVLPTSFADAPAQVTQVATRDSAGNTYIHVVNATASAVAATVNLAGARSVSDTGSATVLTGDPAARNSISAPSTVVPVTSTFTPSLGGFSYTFAANSVTLLTLKAKSSVTPYLPTGKPLSLRVAVPGDSTQYVATSGTAPVVASVTSASSGDARKAASWLVHEGFGDADCYSLESRSNPGLYLRRSGDTVVLSAFEDGNTFAKEATFCTAAGSLTNGLSLVPKTATTRSLRRYGNQLYLAVKGGPNAWDTATGWSSDTTFFPTTSLSRSSVDVALGRASFQPKSANYAGYSLAHYGFLGIVSQTTASSSALTRQDSTFTVVPGLADPSCYSFQSVNYPTRYLRHFNYRIRLDPNDSSTVFAADATFCAQAGNNGSGVSWQSYNFPSRYLRNYNGEVWVASNGGSLTSDATSGWADDTSWTTIAPWAAS